MKNKLLIMTATLVAGVALAGNPLLQPYNTPFETIPFNEIKNEHYMPAFQEAMKQHNVEIDAIINNANAPTFENTIVALERAGGLLSKVSAPFYNMMGAETNDELQEIAQKASPLMTDHSNGIRLNEKLFARVKAVYQNIDKLKLTAEQKTLLTKTYEGFANNGANLSEKDKETYRTLTKELSMLTIQYGQNNLKETNKYSLLITDKNTLSGLPDDVLEMMAMNAKAAGKEGWLIDLKATTYGPLMQYADNRDLRREIFMASNTRSASGGEYDNVANVAKIANVRLKIANLLGHKTYADYVLVRRMAENKENVYKLLNDLLDAYRPTAENELAEMQAFAESKGAYFKLQSWDWSYYAEKLKNEKYAINDEMLKPYFELENVKKGVFGLATRLWGLKFVKNNKIQVYHPEVDVYEVYDAKSKFMSLLYTDFHPRDSKRAGAWMSSFKDQYMVGKKDYRPQVTIVMNFTRPTESKPALLNFDEFTTLLHEFGHALHGMLSQCTYESISGTSVYQDFVELPSQMLEKWGTEKEFLDGFAVHYKTGEKIPAELVQRIKEADNFNTANFSFRQLSFGLLDMAWHTINQPFDGDVIAFEKSAMQAAALLPMLKETTMSTNFGHIFAGGYAAGYYSYKWAEVLDADAFSVFERNGLFDSETAASFRNNILSRGGTEHPMTLYKRFRGQEPTIEALLKRNGIVRKQTASVEL